MPAKEHPGTLKKSKLFPENQLQMEHSTLLMFPESLVKEPEESIAKKK
jgi:hypothetical protein